MDFFFTCLIIFFTFEKFSFFLFFLIEYHICLCLTFIYFIVFSSLFSSSLPYLFIFIRSFFVFSSKFKSNLSFFINKSSSNPPLFPKIFNSLIPELNPVGTNLLICFSFSFSYVSDTLIISCFKNFNKLSCWKYLLS